MSDVLTALSGNINEYLGYFWLILLSAWGGTASYLSRIKQQHIPFSLVELTGEWAISGFSGLLTAYVCTELEMSWPLTAFSTGIAGHLGGRGLFMMETYVKRKFGSLFDNVNEKE